MNIRVGLSRQVGTGFQTRTGELSSTSCTQERYSRTHLVQRHGWRGRSSSLASEDKHLLCNRSLINGHR